MRQSYQDEHGREIRLGKELGSGGEGAVFLIEGDAKRVAKIYHQPAVLQKSKKLAAMVRGQDAALLSLAAWPMGLVTRGGETWGVLLPLVERHKEIHHLYSPAHRKQEYPNAEWSFLIRAARNCAAAFATIHGHGHVVGDVNQGGVLVSDLATVRLIDCDSFQVSDGVNLFTCDVGVPHFTAPELQGKSFRGLKRDVNHDAFGLAVLVFHLLFMGRHPFAGRFHGTGDMPLERAIQECRFAFGQAAASFQMTPPPHAIRLSHVPTDIATLFERAFRSNARYEPRPTADEWVRGLDALEQQLAVCSRHSGHKYFRGLQACPWCEILGGGGPDLFITVNLTTRGGQVINVDSVWKAIEGIRLPNASLPAFPAATLPSGPTVNRTGVEVLMWLSLSAAVVFAIYGQTAPWSMALAAVSIVVFFSAWTRTRALRRERQEMRTKFQALLSELKGKTATIDAFRLTALGELKQYSDEFAGHLKRLRAAKDAFAKLPAETAAELQSLEAKRRDLQFEAHLESFFLEDAKISGVGVGRKATLKSFGIETAWDITAARLSQVPGIGPTRAAALSSWRFSIEKTFKFDATKGVDPAHKLAVQQRGIAKATQLQLTLSNGIMQLKGVALGAQEKHRHAADNLQRLWREAANLQEQLKQFAQ